MILRIDHVGLATAGPAEVGDLLAALGMTRADGGPAPAFGVRCDFWQFGDARQPAVELVSPLAPGSAVDGQLGRTGPGLHHLAVEVDDVEAELARLRAAGAVPAQVEPCPGARPGMRVAFVYLRRPAGLLLELVTY